MKFGVVDYRCYGEMVLASFDDGTAMSEFGASWNRGAPRCRFGSV